MVCRNDKVLNISFILIHDDNELAFTCRTDHYASLTWKMLELRHCSHSR